MQHELVPHADRVDDDDHVARRDVLASRLVGDPELTAAAHRDAEVGLLAPIGDDLADLPAPRWADHFDPEARALPDVGAMDPVQDREHVALRPLAVDPEEREEDAEAEQADGADHDRQGEPGCSRAGRCRAGRYPTVRRRR